MMNRWEERLQDVFNVMPFGFKEDLFRLLIDKMKGPLRFRKQK